MERSQKKLQRMGEVSSTFTPGAPVNTADLFAGRRPQILTLFSVLGQRGQHAVLYGERGVGKTSLANILPVLFPVSKASPLVSVRVNCTTQDTYRSLWLNVFRKLGISQSADGDVTPTFVLETLEAQPKRLLIVIDELDRFGDDEGLSSLADTIKALSDHSVPATLILVGVADSVNELVGDHQSVQRALVQVRMPRMSQRELQEIVDKGLQRLALEIEPPARERIARLSEGLPVYTHLLARDAALSAIEDDRDIIVDADVERATRRAVEKAQQSILSDFERAVRSVRADNLFQEVLLACALTEKNAEGYFSPGSLRAPLAKIIGKPVTVSTYARHLNEFTEASRASVLQRDGLPRRYFYRFTDPLLQPYVILRGIAEGLITESKLLEMRPRDEPDLF